MNPIKVDCPIYLRLSVRGKKYPINLNAYRNWHYIVSNKIKKEFSRVIEPDLKDLKFEGKIGLEFTVFYPDKRRRDRENFISLVSKLFCDSLVNLEVIPDDNDKYIEYSIHRTGGIDKENPRCEVTIFDLSSQS